MDDLRQALNQVTQIHGFVFISSTTKKELGVDELYEMLEEEVKWIDFDGVSNFLSSIEGELFDRSVYFERIEG